MKKQIYIIVFPFLIIAFISLYFAITNLRFVFNREFYTYEEYSELSENMWNSESFTDSEKLDDYYNNQNIYELSVVPRGVRIFSKSVLFLSIDLMTVLVLILLIRKKENEKK